MIKIKEINKIKSIVQKIGKKAFKQPVFLFIFLLFLDLIIGGFLFWQTIFSPKIDDSKPQSLFVLNKATLDKFIQSFSIQEKDFLRDNSQKYPDIFADFATTTTSTSTQSQ